MSTANDLVQFFHTEGKDWIDLENTVDRVTHGDGARTVKKAAVTWMATTRVIHRAAKAGCDLIISHEPIIWNHFDRDEDSVDPTGSAAKRQLLDEHHLTVIRCHDMWDHYPELGVAPTWAKTLGFDHFTIQPYISGFTFILCEFSPWRSLGSIAAHIAHRTRLLGQEMVTVIGEEKLRVDKLALNVGSGGSHAKYMVEARDKYGVQAVVATEFTWWRDGAWALDTGMGLIHVNHGVSECMGVEMLCEFLQNRFPSIEFQYFPEAAPYRMWGDAGAADGKHEWSFR